MTEFNLEVKERIAANAKDVDLVKSAQEFMRASTAPKYCYNFSWLGRPIIQYPQDIVATQELIWSIRPDLVIETGIAHGGSLVLSASILAMLDFEEAKNSGTLLDPSKPRRCVLGVDIDIREHNKAAIEAHPLAGYIEMIQGSSIDSAVIDRVVQRAASAKKVLVFLDSNHTHDHVLAELEAYAHLASVGSYCVVFDTIIEDLPDNMYPDRPWGPGNNPKTAAQHYLESHPEFVVDKEIDNQLLISVTPDGFLKRIK
jgi:cephalosporin hydroxylase